MDSFLIDGYNLGFRCYYAMPDLSRSDGFPTGALHAFFASLLKLASMDTPHATSVFFDKGGSARHLEIFPEYKANRAETPESFRRQVPHMKYLCEIFGFTPVECEGVEADDNKKSKADFALWFTKSKFDNQELKWDSPWGVGYPGWHIECSCISMKHNGEYLDIHCGGIDNAFPHHTNEIAQSEAYLGHSWCPWWFHVHHLNTESGKMSKSKGERLTVSRLIERGYDPIVYRFFVLQSHYRKTLVFSYENLDNAKTAYEKLIGKISSLLGAGGQPDAARLEGLRSMFTEALDNDLNTSLGITALYDVLKSDADAATKLALVSDFDRVLSLDLIENAKRAAGQDSSLPDEIASLLEQRSAARKAKDFAKADELRAKIQELGYTVEETRQGTVVRKK